MKALFATGLLAVALVGCSSTTKPQDHNAQTMPQKHHKHDHRKPHKHGHPPPPMNDVQHFVCENGAKPTIRILNNNQIEFTSPLGDAEPTVMDIATTGSGNRYVAKTGIYGKGGEWHQKGNTAIFTYHDVGSPTTCTLEHKPKPPAPNAN